MFFAIYIIILLVLVLILCATLREEVLARKGITHGMANKYCALREKRRFVRFEEDLKIRYSLIDSKSNHKCTRTKDISKKGLCISTYEKLKKNDLLEVEIEVPSFSKPVKLTASVMWVKEMYSSDKDGKRMFYTGLRSAEIDPESEAVLLAHLGTLKRP